MMKTKTLTLALAFLLIAVVAFAAARDYSTMTTEELANMRNQMQTMSPEDRAAFEREWNSRVQGMTPEDRQRYRIAPDVQEPVSPPGTTVPRQPTPGGAGPSLPSSPGYPR